MNRRKAIRRILLAGGAGIAGFAGYKWYDLKKTPDIGYLDRHKDLIAVLAETIIPATDTPGAREAGVQDFIVVMVRDCATVKEQNQFIDGLKDVDSSAYSHYKRPFVRCTEEQRVAILTHFEKEATVFSAGVAAKVQNMLLGRPFFTLLKEYTTQGYCTSELGATRGLVYLPIPGKYQGCIDLLPGQRAWATK
ncbi:MAG: gluconate 2-dehydrogenase subunit 3 family protein [Puia sp.]|nr:gluconate 2-dehydrogenase subunit 3 family protein [Puia sp.]